MNAKELQKRFYSSMFQRYELIAPNVFVKGESNEMDIIGIRPSGFVDEIEIKLSKADFLADFKKNAVIDGGQDKDWMTRWETRLKHDSVKAGLLTCNYFSFLMPEELADKCEIPDHAGLYILRDGGITNPYIIEIKSAPRLHRRKIDTDFKYEILKKMSYRFWTQFKNG